MFRPLREVWMNIGLEKVDTHEGASVKALLDSSAIGMFISKQLADKQGFKLEKLSRPIKIRNIDGTDNSRGSVTHEVEVNIYFKGHIE